MEEIDELFERIENIDKVNFTFREGYKIIFDIIDLDDIEDTLDIVYYILMQIDYNDVNSETNNFYNFIINDEEIKDYVNIILSENEENNNEIFISEFERNIFSEN